MAISAKIILPGDVPVSLTISGAFPTTEDALGSIEALLVGGLNAHVRKVSMRGKQVALYTNPGVCAFGVKLADTPEGAKDPVWIIDSDAKDPVEHFRAVLVGGALDATVSAHDSEAKEADPVQ